MRRPHLLFSPPDWFAPCHLCSRRSGLQHFSVITALGAAKKASSGVTADRSSLGFLLRIFPLFPLKQLTRQPGTAINRHRRMTPRSNTPCFAQIRGRRVPGNAKVLTTRTANRLFTHLLPLPWALDKMTGVMSPSSIASAALLKCCHPLFQKPRRIIRFRSSRQEVRSSGCGTFNRRIGKTFQDQCQGIKEGEVSDAYQPAVA